MFKFTFVMTPADEGSKVPILPSGSRDRKHRVAELIHWSQKLLALSMEVAKFQKVTNLAQFLPD